MTKDQIIESLIRIHHKYSKERYSDRNSQMCTLWSIKNPPDVLEATKPLNAIEDEFNLSFTEDEAYELYDMEIEDAAGYILKLMERER